MPPQTWDVSGIPKATPTPSDGWDVSGIAPAKPLSMGHATAIRATTWRDRAREWLAMLPAAGGAVGAVVGDVPGAALGAAGGRAWETVLRQLMGEHPPETAISGQTLVPPVAGEGPVRAGIREGAARAVDLGAAALESGVVPEVIGRGIAKGVGGGFAKPAAGTVDADLARANRELGLRMPGPTLRPGTTIGTVGEHLHQFAERGLSGTVIGALNRAVGRRAAVRTVAEGAGALQRVGAALGDVVRQGPPVDLIADKTDAALEVQRTIFPRILNLYDRVLPSPLKTELQTYAAAEGQPGAVATGRAMVNLLTKVRKVVSGRGPQAVPTEGLDALIRYFATKDDVPFRDAAALRSALGKAARRDDPVLGDAGKLTVQGLFRRLTDTMGQLSTQWDALRQVDRSGYEAMRDSEVARFRNSLTREEQRRFPGIAPAGTGRPPAGPLQGNEAQAFRNLTMVSEALKRIKGRETWHRMYEILELATGTSLIATGHFARGAELVATMEVLPGMITAAMYSPTITQWMVEGLSAAAKGRTAVAVSNLARAYQAYQRFQAEQPTDRPAAAAPQGAQQP